MLRSTLGKCLGMSATLMTISSAYCAEVVFPTAGGDLASGWATKPSATDTAVIAQGGTYTLGEDVSFNNLSVTTKDSVVFDFTQIPGKTLTLLYSPTNTTFDIKKAGFAFAPTNTKSVAIALKGGVWDCSGKGHFYAAPQGVGGNLSTGGTLTISDGAVITNAGNVVFGAYTKDMMAILDGSSIYATRLNNWASGHHNTFVITNGAQVKLSGKFGTDSDGSPTSTTGFNRICVTGRGSLLETSNDGDVGQAHQSARLEVMDSARLSVAGTIRMGQSRASNAVFTVTGCSTATVTTVIVGAYDQRAQGARFEVSDSAFAQVDKLRVGPISTSGTTKGQAAPFCSTVVSNAELNVTGDTFDMGAQASFICTSNGVFRLSSGKFDIGFAEGSNSNQVRVTGGSVLDLPARFSAGVDGSWNAALVEDSCVTCGTVLAGVNATAHDNKIVFRNSELTLSDTVASTSALLLGKGHDNEVTLDGTDLSLNADSYLRLSDAGSNNVLRLIGGSTLKVPSKTASLGNGSVDTVNDEIYVGADSTLDLVYLRYVCRDSRLVVSNGTVKTSNEFRMDYNIGTNNVLRLEGDCPRIESGADLKLEHGGRLELVMPRSRYAEDFVPIKANKLVFDATSRIVVTGDEFYSYEGGRVTLAEVTGSITLPAAAVTASLAEMPAGCKLYKSGKKLIFSAPSRKGMILIVR